MYRPGSDSLLLAAEVAVRVRPADRVLDVFTGSGIQAITAAVGGAAEVLAIDVSRAAMLSVVVNSRLNGVNVRPLRGELFQPVAGRRFDLILANPPFVPSAAEPGRVRGAARAWEGGADGRRLLDPFLRELPDHLAPGGRVLIVHSSTSDVTATLATLDSAGLRAEIAAARSEPLGPITAPRADALEARGLLEQGQRTEDTVVISATAPISLRRQLQPAPVALAPS